MGSNSQRSLELSFCLQYYYTKLDVESDSQAYYLMQSPETMSAGDAVGFGSAFLFACVFGIRLYNSRKLVPSGLLLALSLGALGVFYSAYLQDKV